MGDEQGDERLVERARSGDGVAFACLIERYQQALSGYLLHLTGDREVALDLTQDAFVRAFHALRQTKPRLLFKPWLYRIATNLAYDYLRRQRRIRWLPLGVVDRQSPADPVAGVGEQDLVQRTLARLRPDERTVLLLYGLEGVSYPEAAVILGGSPEAIRKRFTRAKERFRHIYAELDR